MIIGNFCLLHFSDRRCGTLDDIENPGMIGPGMTKVGLFRWVSELDEVDNPGLIGPGVANVT